MKILPLLLRNFPRPQELKQPDLEIALHIFRSTRFPYKEKRAIATIKPILLKVKQNYI
ncbi:hypothetical protein Hanom_Chr14g01264171 [Helianthus anomalus]